MRRLHREVFVDAAVPDSWDLRARAVALLLPPGAAVARETAAWLYGVDARRPGEHLDLPRITCVTPAGSVTPLRRRGVRCYQADLTGDVVTRDGVPCTTPLRTAVDLLRYAPPFIGLASADTFARRGLIDPDQVVAEIERWHGERYIDRARRLARVIEPRSESPGESWLRLRILDAGFPRPSAQIWVPGQRPGAYRLDLGYEHLRVGIEYDGELFHDGAAQRPHDERRRTRLEREHGWRVIGAGRGDVLGTAMALERAVGELLGLEPAIIRRRW